jgi:hypothetical protein
MKTPPKGALTPPADAPVATAPRPVHGKKASKARKTT